MAANNSKSTNYWLGGYWTNGTARGLIWKRGRWSGGTWLKGQWHSNTLQVQWNNYDPHKNKWSIWESGIWSSNSVNEYLFEDFKLGDEYSVWHGGIWKSKMHEGATYTWQGENVVERINVYGNINLYDCDNLPNISTRRRILLPSSNSLFLGGQWLRGEWHGGIFANSVWHSLMSYESNVSFLDEVFFLFEHDEYMIFQNNDPEYSEIVNDYSILIIDVDGNIIKSNDSIILYSTEFKTELSYYDDLNYDASVSTFTSGAVVNSVWEGGTVVDTGLDDPYNIMFGMSITKSNNNIFDDGGIQPKNGLGTYESIEILHTKMYGLNHIDWDTYLKDGNANKVIKLEHNIDVLGNNLYKYTLPLELSNTHIYSNIWKRGDFQHGVFNYGQFYDYTIKNVINTEYIQNPNINDLNDDNRFDIYDSLFRKGLFYKSIFYGGVFLAQYYNERNESLKSVFNRSLWATGYWVAASEYDYGQMSSLPASDFTDNEYITNAKFWKSVWLNGIWEGGNMALSSWNCVNPFNYDITLNNETFLPSVDYNNMSDFIFDNIRHNPLGKILNLTYYDENNNYELYDEYKNIISDFNRTDFLNIINSDALINFDMVINKKYIYLYYFHEDEIISNCGISGYSDCDPYDFVLSNSTYPTGPELVTPNYNGVPIECINTINNCPTWSEYVQYGNIMLLDEDSYLNDDVLNENIFRTLGLVHNLLSIWQNGVFEGGVWNGGLWLKGEFKPYTYERYPDNVLDFSGLPVKYDYFDDNISHTIDKYDNAIWTRGVFYAGYFHTKSLFFAIPAYITDVGVYQLNVTLDNKLCINDDIISTHFNNITTNYLQLKPLNFVSLFARKASRAGNPNFKLFSVMNGQFMSGYFLDRLQPTVSDVPVVGTISFPEDLVEGANIPMLTFGHYRIMQIYQGLLINRGTVVNGDIV